ARCIFRPFKRTLSLGPETEADIPVTREKAELDRKRVVPLGLAGRCAGPGLLAFPFLPSAFRVCHRPWHWIPPSLPYDQPDRPRSEQVCTADDLCRAPHVCTTGSAHCLRGRWGANQSCSVLGRPEHPGRRSRRLPDP